MNNIWNVNFLQNTRCIQKVIKTEAVFTKTEMNNTWNVNFIQNTRCIQKVIKTEAVFTKTEMNNVNQIHWKCIHTQLKKKDSVTITFDPNKFYFRVGRYWWDEDFPQRWSL